MTRFHWAKGDCFHWGLRHLSRALSSITSGVAAWGVGGWGRKMYLIQADLPAPFPISGVSGKHRWRGTGNGRDNKASMQAYLTKIYTEVQPSCKLHLPKSTKMTADFVPLLLGMMYMRSAWSRRGFLKFFKSVIKYIVSCDHLSLNNKTIW